MKLSLQILDALDPNARFDRYKYCILGVPDLLEPFIKKYGDRCKINTPESWNLFTCKTREDCERACEILGYDKNTTKYKNKPERDSNDDDDSDDNESDDDNECDDYKRKQHKDQKNTKQKTTYICKYCGIKTAVRNLSGNCSRSPNHKHTVFDDSGRSDFYCEYCGKSTTRVSGFCSGICNRSPTKHHVLYSGPELSRYSCKYCGSKQSTITRLCSGQCYKSPTKFHVASS